MFYNQKTKLDSKLARLLYTYTGDKQFKELAESDAVTFDMIYEKTNSPLITKNLVNVIQYCVDNNFRILMSHDYLTKDEMIAFYKYFDKKQYYLYTTSKYKLKSNSPTNLITEVNSKIKDIASSDNPFDNNTIPVYLFQRYFPIWSSERKHINISKLFLSNIQNLAWSRDLNKQLAYQAYTPNILMIIGSYDSLNIIHNSVLISLLLYWLTGIEIDANAIPRGSRIKEQLSTMGVFI